jgi:sugar diacid utilization regulator
MAQLIEGNGGRQTIRSDQSLRYGVDLRLPYRMLLTSIRNGQPPPSTSAYRAINQVLTQTEAQAVAAQFAGQVAILAQAEQDIDELAQALLEQLEREESGVSIGISSALTGADDVGGAYQQCNEVLEISQRLNSAGSIHHFDDLGYIYTLYHAGPASLSQNPQVPILRQLLVERGAHLFNTLETYLDAGANSVQTAETLHIHRSTLNYRLARIKDICAVDLSSAPTRLNLQIALKLMRLFNDIEGS